MSHLTLTALLYVYPDSITALNANYLKYVLALATFLNNLNRFDVNKTFLGLPSKLLQTCANEIFTPTQYSPYTPQSPKVFARSVRFNNVLQLLRLLAISYDHHSHCNICLILWMFRPLCFSQYGPFHQILRTDKEVSRVFICGDPRPHSTCSSNLLHSVGNKHSTLSLVSERSKLEQH